MSVLQSYMAGRAARQQENQMMRQNMMQQYMQQNAQGIFKGDEGALAGLAAFDPNMALGVASTRGNMDRAARGEARDSEMHSARLAEIRAQAAARAAEAARNGEIQIEDEREELISNALVSAYQAYKAGDENAYNGILQQFELDPSEYPMQNFPALAAQVEGTMEGIKSVRELTGEAGNENLRVQSSEILQDGTTVMVMTDGNSRVVSPDGSLLEGQAAAEAIEAARKKRAEYEREVYGARRTGTNIAEADTGAAAAAAGAAGTSAIKASEDAFSQSQKLATSLSNMDDALDALDRGARAGAVDRYLPSVTEASASLRNSMDRMGLDVIGAVTFGALSEGELRLAMETAVPRNLDEPQLREWLERKREATQKTMDMLLDAAVFLGTPGNTVADWIERNRSSGVADSGSPTAPSGANQALDAIESDPEIQRLLQQYGQ